MSHTLGGRSGGDEKEAAATVARVRFDLSFAIGVAVARRWRCAKRFASPGSGLIISKPAISVREAGAVVAVNVSVGATGNLPDREMSASA